LTIPLSRPLKSIAKEPRDDASAKPEKPVKHPARPTGEEFDARALVERTMKRFP